MRYVNSFPAAAALISASESEIKAHRKVCVCECVTTSEHSWLLPLSLAAVLLCVGESYTDIKGEREQVAISLSLSPGGK